MIKKIIKTLSSKGGKMDNKKINFVIDKIPRSGIRRIMDKAIELDPKRKKIIHLEVGEPHEPTSKKICEYISGAALNGFTKYTQNAGFLELRKTIKEKLAKDDIFVSENNIFVTPGATYGVAVAIGIIINPGDEVLVPDPGYPNFPSVVRHYGGIPKFYTLDEKNNFQTDINEIKLLTAEKTKMVIINSPSNPTGAVLKEKQIKDLVNFTSQNNIWLLSDEVYEAFVFNGQHTSPLKYPDVDNVVGIYSFSKSYNITGLRVGYTVSRNEKFCNGLIKAQELYISCAPSTSQIAAIKILKNCEDIKVDLKNKFKMKLDTALDILGENVKYLPEGAFYILINISKTGLSSNEFADILLEEKQVAVAPGITFGPLSDRYIRVALTADIEQLKEGLNRIKNCLNKYTGEK